MFDIFEFLNIDALNRQVRSRRAHRKSRGLNDAAVAHVFQSDTTKFNSVESSKLTLVSVKIE